MARSKMNFICVTANGDVQKYAAREIYDIVNTKDNDYDPFMQIISIGLHSDLDTEFNDIYGDEDDL